ncbi:MAG TPA: DUF2804 domain-containing protein [Clostridia bacterium]|nr:DUF2804 domain-containing protein [Clostridia bacterium]
MVQNEIKKRQPLLNKEGNIANPGYAKTLLWDYNRENISASRMRIKEWDYYYIGNDEGAICLTISDMGYVGALSATVMDFLAPSQITQTSVCLFPMGKMKMPATSVVGDAIWKNKDGAEMNFINDGKTRHLYGKYPKFGTNGEGLSFDIVLSNPPAESMVIATPFKKKGHFYYNQKINCMKANGIYKLGNKVYKLNDANKSLATLDWGRGVWTYDNTWYWGSLQAILDDGSTFGWNIGYGFGDNDQATENMLFYKGKSHKLDEVTFNIPEKDGQYDYMAKWLFTSNDDRFYMEFTPIIDRYAPFDLKVISMIPHQVFGRFTGYAVLDDGTKIEVKDLLGFAEHVHNRW